jgi:hypothetical protein
MKIKEIYALRWGIETSFRELKYAIGLSNFHAKKVAYIKQEIFARLTLFLPSNYNEGGDKTTKENQIFLSSKFHHRTIYVIL